MLTEDQRAQVRTLADEIGEDPADLLAAAEKLADEAAGADAEPAPTAAGKPAAEVKIFAYHLPFLTAGEVRQSIGFAPDGVPDANLPSGKWLEKHGGGTPSTPSDNSGI